MDVFLFFPHNLVDFVSLSQSLLVWLLHEFTLWLWVNLRRSTAQTCARVCDCFLLHRVCCHWHHAPAPPLFRSQSIAGSRFISRAMLHKTHCSRDTHPDHVYKMRRGHRWDDVKCKSHWDSDTSDNSFGTVSHFIMCTYSVYTNMIWQEKKHTHLSPYTEQMVFFAWGFFFIYSIKVLVFCSFRDADELELGQNKHSEGRGGWREIYLSNG